MDCDSARVALSARIDGEDPGPLGDDLDAHLATCAECRAWQQRAHAVTRRARLGGAFLDHDLTDAVLASVPVTRTGRWRRLVPRGALVVLALGQFAIALPMLLGHDHDAGLHAAHELGSFNLALAIAFAVGAVRPRLSAGLAWPCGIAAAGLVVTALADLAGGQTIGADEAAHLVALAGAALLAWQARPSAAPVAGPAAAADTERSDLKLAESDVATTGWAVARTRPGHGGDAARLAASDSIASPGAAGATTAGTTEPAAGFPPGAGSGRAGDASGHRDESVA